MHHTLERTVCTIIAINERGSFLSLLLYKDRFLIFGDGETHREIGSYPTMTFHKAL